MKKVEITYRSNCLELEKLNQRLERATKRYEKKLAKAEKLGVAEWDDQMHRDWLKTVPTQDGFIINKSDIEKNGAWLDLQIAGHDVEDVQGRIERAEKKFQKAEEQLDEYHKELEKLENLQRKEELRKLEFEQEQMEWLKDGIHLEARYYGTTPSGKRFFVTRNSGFTVRSLHCFTLYVDGEMIFSSGEFWRCYLAIKNK